MKNNELSELNAIKEQGHEGEMYGDFILANYDIDKHCYIGILNTGDRSGYRVYIDIESGNIERIKRLMYNPYIHLKDNTTILFSSNGIPFMIDTLDYKLATSKCVWTCWENSCGQYQVQGKPGASVDPDRKKLRLGRMLLGMDKNDTEHVCDHLDGNTLNCRRSNLRSATYSENAINRRERRSGKSKTGAVGVYPTGRILSYGIEYHAVIQINSTRIELGSGTFNKCKTLREKAEQELFKGKIFH